jgi:hypothetical protein
MPRAKQSARIFPAGARQFRQTHREMRLGCRVGIELTPAALRAHDGVRHGSSGGGGTVSKRVICFAGVAGCSVIDRLFTGRGQLRQRSAFAHGDASASAVTGAGSGSGAGGGEPPHGHPPQGDASSNASSACIAARIIAHPPAGISGSSSTTGAASAPGHGRSALSQPAQACIAAKTGVRPACNTRAVIKMKRLKALISTSSSSHRSFGQALFRHDSSFMNNSVRFAVMKIATISSNSHRCVRAAQILNKLEAMILLWPAR